MVYPSDSVITVSTESAVTHDSKDPEHADEDTDTYHSLSKNTRSDPSRKRMSHKGSEEMWIYHTPSVGILQSFRLVIAGIVGLIVITALCYGLYTLFHILRGKTARFVVVLISLGLTIGMLVELVEMERTRNVMKEITGTDSQDNQWGFGQVIALFLWMPLCIQLVYYAARITYSQITKEPQADMDDAEKQS